MELILASASPRRKQLMAACGYECRIQPAHVDESLCADETPEQMVTRLAIAKARTVAENNPGELVLGADTVVVADQTLLGKPADLDHARQMLMMLSDKTHYVLTGVALVWREKEVEDVWSVRTDVTFNKLDTQVIESYFAKVNPLDKAGAYAVQEHGDVLVKSIDGPMDNVIGLPMDSVIARLKRLGVG